MDFDVTFLVELKERKTDTWKTQQYVFLQKSWPTDSTYYAGGQNGNINGVLVS